MRSRKTKPQQIDELVLGSVSPKMAKESDGLLSRGRKVVLTRSALDSLAVRNPKAYLEDLHSLHSGLVKASTCFVRTTEGRICVVLVWIDDDDLAVAKLIGQAEDGALIANAAVWSRTLYVGNAMAKGKRKKRERK